MILSVSSERCPTVYETILTLGTDMVLEDVTEQYETTGRSLLQ